MISDVLFQAIQEIEEYQRDFPMCYDDVGGEIDRVKEAMRSLQRTLNDQPPDEAWFRSLPNATPSHSS
jgi:hypothetical protein